MSSDLQNTLQTEYPHIDSSLVAALLGELELFDSEGAPRSQPIPKTELDALRETLAALAAGVDSDFDDFEDHLLDTTDDDDTFATSTTQTSAGTSEASLHSFSSPLGFLQAALPDISTQKLREALAASPVDADDMDMEALIEFLLTQQYISELEERGIEALDLEDGSSEAPEQWGTVEKKKDRKKGGVVNKDTKRPKPARGTTIVIADIRQKQHILPASPTFTTPYTDPWTQLTSLSSHLSTLLHPHTASFFQSYFHSPKYNTPVHAVRAALTAIASAVKPSSSTVLLFGILDIIRASPEYAYDTLDVEQKDQFIEDVQLAVSAALATHAPAEIARPGEFGEDSGGGASEALDIVRLLHELKEGLMGVYHETPLSSPLTPIRYASVAADRPPHVPASLAQPPPVPPPPPSKHNPSKRKTTSSVKANPYQWQAVPMRTAVPRGPHTHAQHIPAYNTDVNGMRVRSKGAKVPTTSATMKQGIHSIHGGVGSTSYENNTADIRYRRRMAEALKRRDALLREASRAWSRGSSNTRGGEVAAYFAERARQCQDMARREALEAAREMVETKRLYSMSPDTVDLHGTTSAEAVIIVEETLLQQKTSANKPLTIITGKGKHSAGNVGVLKPAIKAALQREGWNVTGWDGGLVVRGKT